MSMETTCELVNENQRARSRDDYQHDDSVEWSNSCRRDPSDYVSDSSESISESNESTNRRLDSQQHIRTSATSASILPTPFSIENILGTRKETILDSYDDPKHQTRVESSRGSSISPLVRPTAIPLSPSSIHLRGTLTSYNQHCKILLNYWSRFVKTQFSSSFFCLLWAF